MRSSDLLKRAVQLSQSSDISPELRERLFPRIFVGIALLVLVGLVFSGNLMSPSPVVRAAQLSSLVLLLGVWVLYKSRLGYLALSVLVWGFWALVTLLIVSQAGATSIWLVPQFLIVVFTRFVLTARMAIFLGLLTGALDFAIYQFQLHRLLPPAIAQLAVPNEGLAISIGLLYVLLIFNIADAVLRETFRQAQLNEGRYRSLFANTTDAVFLIDPDYRFIETNQQAADLIGIAKEELVGRSVLEVSPQEDAKFLQGSLERLKKEGSLAPFDRVVTRRDGSLRMTEVNINMVTDTQGAPRFFLAVMRDVTERNRLENDLRLSLGEMESLAMQDPLTGLLNRRALMEHTEAEWHRSLRERRPMCVALIDLDNFKDINDTMGHLTGDKLIRQVASVIQSCLRRYDWAGRWGGDEFMLVLPGANLVDARQVAERLRNEYVISPVIAEVNPELQPYLSIGIAVFSGRPGDEINVTQLFAQADKALYKAKQQGKNQVEVFRDGEDQL